MHVHEALRFWAQESTPILSVRCFMNGTTSWIIKRELVVALYLLLFCLELQGTVKSICARKGPRICAITGK